MTCSIPRWTLARRTTLAALALLAGPDARADVRIVGNPAAGAGYATIQAAVDASSDGDLILVEAATSPGFTVAGKSLSIFAWPNRKPQVQGMILVRDLAPAQVVVLDGLAARGETLPDASRPGLTLLDNDGFVRLHACDLNGANGELASTQHLAGEGAWVRNSPRVLFRDCTLLGGSGAGYFLFSTGYAGAAGVRVTQSTVAFYECSVQGGRGGEADAYTDSYAGDGASALLLDSGGVFAAASRFQGGEAGCAYNGGDAGDGVFLAGGSGMRAMECTIQSGSTSQNVCDSMQNVGAPGQDVGGSGLYFDLAREPIGLAAAALAADAGRALLTIQTRPGDRVWLFATRQPAMRFVAPWNGYAVFAPNTPALVPGRTAAGVEMALEVILPDQGDAAHTLFAQALVLPAAGGQAVLSAPLAIQVLDAAGLTPDCDGNGRFDGIDQAVDSFSDLNGDGLLDACDATLTTLHVDASAAGGGDGSANAPFNNLAAALAAASSGDTVTVADGTYSGPANRGLTLSSKSLRLRSQNGSNACTFDLQFAGGLLSVLGTSQDLVLEGLTVSHASGTAVGFSGRNIRLSNCRLTSATTASSVLSVSAGGSVVLEGVRIDQNAASWLATIQVGRELRMVDCTFFENDLSGAFASQGVTLACTGPYDVRQVISRCRFIANQAPSQPGAALTWVPQSGRLRQRLTVDNCLFGGNRFGSGAAAVADLTLSQGAVSFDTCTFAWNDSGTDGSMLAFKQLLPGNRSFAVLSNCVARGNLSGGPANVTSSAPETVFYVDHCDLQGGRTSVDAGPSGSVVWGPGNFDFDPLFVDFNGPDDLLATFGDNDYRLAAGSPCIDAGSNPSLSADLADLDADGLRAEATPFDLAGNTRRSDDPSAPDSGVGPGPIVDMGAYERP